MSIFSAEAEAPAVTGTDILRRALYARLAKGALPRIARDLSVGIAVLEDFARGHGSLPPEVKRQLAREFFNADFDGETDRLRSNAAPPIPAGIRPEPHRGRKVHPSELFPRPPGYLPVAKTTPPPPKPKRPGWE